MDHIKRVLPALFESIPEETGIGSFISYYCFLPRILNSASDALYCVKFLTILSELKVPKMNFLNTLSATLRSLMGAVQCCTLNESENIGIFIIELFRLMDKWTDV